MISFMVEVLTRARLRIHRTGEHKKKHGEKQIIIVITKMNYKNKRKRNEKHQHYKNLPWFQSTFVILNNYHFDCVAFSVNSC